MALRKILIVLLLAVIASVVVFFVTGGLKKKGPSMADLSGGYVGEYEADLPARGSPGRLIMMTVMDDNTVKVVTDYRNGKAVMVEEGNWNLDGMGRLVVFLRTGGGIEYKKPEKVVFESGEGVLVAVDYNIETYGVEGLPFTKKIK
ncbi:MAG: hypothetical protein PHG66_05140 [Candidatus Colwellbacteria bacterium]|nr:hypothetical protein [Candidatus Colwellbacteria bacterium]